MLNKLICRIAGHHPWVLIGSDIREVDGCMEVYVSLRYGRCKRCDAATPEAYKEELIYRFHSVEINEPVRLTQKIDRFDGK